MQLFHAGMMGPESSWMQDQYIFTIEPYILRPGS